MFLSSFPRRFCLMVLSVFALLLLSTSAVAQTPAPAFDGIEKWKGSLTATTIASLQNWYSTDPPAKFMGADGKPVPGIAPETDFWQKLVSSGATDIEVHTLGEEDQEA